MKKNKDHYIEDNRVELKKYRGDSLYRARKVKNREGHWMWPSQSTGKELKAINLTAKG